MVYSHASRKMLHSILSVKVPKLLTYFVSEPRWIEPSYGKVHRIGGNARLVYSQNSQRHAPPYSLSAHMSENPISADQFFNLNSGTLSISLLIGFSTKPSNEDDLEFSQALILHIEA